MTPEWHRKYCSVFHVQQAVPVFFVLLGLNTGLSFRYKQLSAFKKLYSISYFKSRFKRIGLPFIAIFLLSLAIGFFKSEISVGYSTLMGVLPYSGPGNYFITALFQFLVLFPAIYWLYVRKPKLAVTACFSLDLAFELTAPHISLFMHNDYLYSSSIFRYLSAIALGLWLSEDYDLHSRRNRFIWGGAMLSIGYIVTSWWPNPPFTSMWGWRTENVFSFFYPAILVLISIKYLPDTRGRAVNSLGYIGNASFHIFLVQIIYFKVMPVGFKSIFLNLFVCVAIGIMFFAVENGLKVQPYKIRQTFSALRQKA